MIWTVDATQVHVHPAAAGMPVLVDRRENTVWFDLNKDEALGLMQEISKAFGVESVPSRAAFERVRVVVEKPNGFFPKEIE